MSASLAIAAPSDAAFLHGSTKVTVTVGGETPETVELWVDGTSQLTTQVSPFAFDWNSDAVSEGSHELRVLGRRGAQNWLSDPITVHVDRSAPSVMSRTPEPSSQNQDIAQPIVIRFSEPMDPASFTDASVVLSVNGTPASVPATRALSENNTVLTISPGSEIKTPAVCQVAVTVLLHDLAGNALTLPSDTWSWSAPPWQRLGNAPAILGGYGTITRAGTGESYVFGSDTTSFGLLLVSELVGDQWTALASSNDDAQLTPIYPEQAAAGPEGEVWVMAYTHDLSPSPLFQHWDGAAWSTISNPTPLTSNYSAAGWIDLVANRPGSLAAIWNPYYDNANTEVQIWKNSQWSALPLLPNRDSSSDGYGPFAQGSFEADGSLLVVGATGANIWSSRWTGNTWSPLTGFLQASKVFGLRISVGQNQTYLSWNEGNAIDFHVATLDGSTWKELPRTGELPTTAIGVPSLLATARGPVLTYFNQTTDKTAYQFVVQRFDAQTKTWLTFGMPLPASKPQNASLLSDSSGRVVVLDPATGATYRWNE